MIKKESLFLSLTIISSQKKKTYSPFCDMRTELQFAIIMDELSRCQISPIQLIDCENLHDDFRAIPQKGKRKDKAKKKKKNTFYHVERS